MSDDAKEQLSALADDELSRQELQFLARRLGNDRDGLAQLGRYCLIREAFRGDITIADERLADRVARALEAEPAIAKSNVTRRRVLRPVAGVAVAASVALATLALWPQPAERGVTGRPAPTVASNSTSGSELRLADEGGASQVSDAGQRWDGLHPRVKQRLTGYMVNHSRFSSSGRLGGVVSFSRIAGHDGSD